MISAAKHGAVETAFASINRRMIRRQFHCVHLRGTQHLECLDRSLPIIGFGNHSNWWDGLVDFYLGHDLLRVDSFMMVGERQLKRYPFFRWIGAFSVNRASGRDLVASVDYAVRLFDRRNRLLWIYPQGELLPNDFRPLKFLPGILRIAEKLEGVQLLPVVHRYEFLGEQRPEVFVNIGQPMTLKTRTKRELFLEELQARLTGLLDETCRSISGGKAGSSFTQVLHGRSSTNVLFDRFRERMP